MDGKQIAFELSKIHTHAAHLLKYDEHNDENEQLFDNPDEIVYREKDVIELLKKLGHPEPDWGGGQRE